jgi:hypothetical protein
MSLALFTSQLMNEIKKTPPSTYLMLVILILINLYGLYSSALGKIISLFAVIYIVLNENIKLGLISFFIVLLLNNNKNKEGFENEGNTKDEKNAKDNSTPSNDTSSNTNDISEINDQIASFKKLHCKNSKIMKDGNEINIDDMTSTFPQLKFNLENEKCNPCEDNCDFKITSSKERLTAEERLRPTSSTAVAVN